MSDTMDTALHATGARTAPTQELRMAIGVVVEVDGEAHLVSTEGRLLEARRAVSCLIELQVGDRVSLLLEPHGVAPVTPHVSAHVTAVLARTSTQPMRIVAPQGLRIESPQDAGLHLEAGTIHAVAKEGHWLMGSLKLVLGELRGEARSIKWVSQLAHGVLGSLHLVAERSFRHVQESDHQRSAYLDIEAEQLAQIRSRNTMITSTQLTRVDGAQIHVG